LVLVWIFTVVSTLFETYYLLLTFQSISQHLLDFKNAGKHNLFLYAGKQIQT